MLETQIPKDIRKYESKLVGPFTLRQLICFIIACLVAYIVFKITKPLTGSNTAVTICFFTVIPVVAFGWIKPYGMQLEKFLQTALITNLLAPKHRKYKTRNGFRVAETRLRKMDDKSYKKRMRYEKKLAQQNEKYVSYK